MFRPEPDGETSDAITVDHARAQETRTLELLALCEEFLRTASPAVHHELRIFLSSQGDHPITGLPAFLDILQFTVAPPTPPKD